MSCIPSMTQAVEKITSALAAAMAALSAALVACKIAAKGSMEVSERGQCSGTAGASGSSGAPSPDPLMLAAPDASLASCCLPLGTNRLHHQLPVEACLTCSPNLPAPLVVAKDGNKLEVYEQDASW